MASETAAIPGFSEKDFYLAEFRGRAVAIALEGADEAGFEALGAVLDQFSANGTRVLVLTEDPELLEKIVPNGFEFIILRLGLENGSTPSSGGGGGGF